jgi:hypothetical protein
MRWLWNAELMIFEQTWEAISSSSAHICDQASKAHFDFWLSQNNGDPLLKTTSSVELKPKLILVLANQI